jgi:hypothetical protein
MRSSSSFVVHYTVRFRRLSVHVSFDDPTFPTLNLAKDALGLAGGRLVGLVGSPFKNRALG